MTPIVRARQGARTNPTADPRPARRPWFILVALILTLMPLAAPLGAAPAAPARAQTLAGQAGHSAASTDAFTGTTPVTATYTNPIYASVPMSTGVNEDCPDPSIIQGQTAGDTDWYAYCTSGPLNNNDRDSTGHLVIHRIKMLSSHDLAHWTYRGDVLGKSTDTPSTRPSWLTSDNTWAPDIRYFNNQYYLYYTGPDTPDGSAIFVVTGTTPLGPWTADPNPVVEPEAPPHCCAPTDRRWTFDSALVTDDTISPTRTYIFYGSFFGGLSARLLSADGLTSSVSETQVMTGRTPLADIAIANRYEGAYVVKHGGYFYLFASATNCCNGALTSYGVFVGRAPHALGPYIDREGNSFLSGRVGGDPVVLPNGNSLVGIGHNAIFTDEGGQDWYVSHALQRANPTFTDAGGGTPPRRPFVMDPLDWGADGWPVVRGGFGASDTPQPAPAAQPGEVSAYTPVFAQPEQPGLQYNGLSDEFNGNSYGPQWSWVRGDPSVPLSYTVSGGSFNMDTQPADLQPQGNNPPKAASILTEATPAGDYIVDTKVHLNLPPEGCCRPDGSLLNYVQAGLVIYGDNYNYVKLVHVSIFETRQTEFGKHDATGYGNGVDGTPGDDTYLRIVKTTNSSTGEELYRAYTSQDGVHFVRGGVWTHNLGSNARIGLVSMGGSGYTANFDYVHVYQLAGESGTVTPTVTVPGTQTVAPSVTVTGTQTTTPIASSTPTVPGSPTATVGGSPTTTNTGTSVPTTTSTSVPTATNSPTNTATNTATNSPTNTAIKTAVPATATGTATLAPATATGTATSAPATATVSRTATSTPTRPTSRGCVVAFVQLRAQPHARSRPALAVNDLRNVFGEGSRATSSTPLFFSDGRLVAFYSSRSYRSLACGRYTLFDVRGVIIGGGTNLRGRRHTNLRGDAFRVRVTRDAARRRQPLTFSVRVEIPRIGFDRTYHHLRGAVDILRR